MEALRFCERNVKPVFISPRLLKKITPLPTCRKIHFAENRAKGRERQDESKPTNTVLAQLKTGEHS